MLKANIKRAFFILLTLTLIGLSGCSSPEEKKADRMGKAIETWSAGDHESALAILDQVLEDYPNDPEVLHQIGNIYQDLGDVTMAAFYLEQAQIQNPDDIELLYQAFRAQEAAGQSATATQLLEALANADPNAMSSDLWLQLGQNRASQQLIEPALEAYLRGVRPNVGATDPETAVAIGELFKKAGNLTQAERWFKIGTESEDPNALTALFGLLAIKLQNREWAEAETVIAQLDATFPGAVDASEWSEAREELKRWRAAQAQMRAELARTSRSREVEPEPTPEAETAAPPEPVEDSAVAEVSTDATTMPPADDSGGKAQAAADAAAFEALADSPAVEQTTPESETPAIAFDPNIPVQPAEPDLSFGVTFDQQRSGAATSYSVGTTPPPIPQLTPDPSAPPAVAPAPRPRPLSVEELLDTAEAAENNRDFQAAISHYWQALGLASDRADIWNLLSRAYLVAGESGNAATTALEAMRLSPESIPYTLDYLRVVQRSKSSDDFLAELETAYDRFPRSPEITLSLARAYDRIGRNADISATLYQRFIDLAPNHPLRPEAETALRRLR